MRSRLGRRRELYEFGDLTRDEYLARRERLQQRLEAPPRARTETELERNGEQIRTLVDEWDEMTLEERRALIGVVFPAVQDWLPYIAAATAHLATVETRRKARDLHERKTGVEHAEVVTARLLQDERGWLRLAG